MRAFLFLFSIILVASCGDRAAADARKESVAASREGGAKGASGKSQSTRDVPHPGGPYGQRADDWVLTFSEEFERFNKDLWNDHIWYEKPNPTQNFAVEDGRLKIWPQRDATGKFFNRTLDTDGKFSQTYGYFEMEAKLPRGKGTWPAFWLFNHPGDRRPEIDIMEAYAGGEGWGFVDKKGMHRPNVYGTTVWIGDGSSAGSKMNETHKDLSEGFHKYAVKWEPDRQTFYFDGKEVMSVRTAMHDPLYIILDLWFGSASGEPDDSTPQGRSNAFEVNYVRAWRARNVPSSERILQNR
ncbi:glycoside hydrolase family 16 protein [Noviherbaspirillum sp. 17J57-3]|uniref:Glycoside hydrolase family 16 protein n=2 Tax=Noviherbaspirillum galbum TaxID=2709383 RepID=A0A6B3SPZ4_9BURK|nr:glycoside hydrolase family 16 protein [Noviherbaspirillum galbum]